MKRLKRIGARDGPQRQQKSIDFARIILHVECLHKNGAETPHSPAKGTRLNICTDILNNIVTDPDLLDKV